MLDYIAVHEASHAVAGLCLGRRGLLKNVSVVETATMKGGCVWDVVRGKCSPGEENHELAVQFAGPIGQVMLCPESVAPHASDFNRTVFQPDEVLDSVGCAGWASDLNFVIWSRRSGWPLEGCMEIEQRTKALLARPSVSAAIAALAAQLETGKEIAGADAEELAGRYLETGDFVGSDYFG